MNPYFLDTGEANQLAQLEVMCFLNTEWDEFWSYVGKKSWTWYAIERRSGCILAYQNGRRTDKMLLKLVGQSSPFAHHHLPYGRLGCLFTLLAFGIQANRRQRQYLENRTKKSQFPNAFEAIKPTNHLFFKERRNT